ncbi:RNA binding protein [Cupriavidus sp. HMR-1]|nr:RNA binding protein [Cupriavidus sp. HMR-1]
MGITQEFKRAPSAGATPLYSCGIRGSSAAAVPSDRNFLFVVDVGRRQQQADAAGGKEHQCQEVRAGGLDDQADDDRHADAGDVAAQVHHAAEEAHLVAGAQHRRDGPEQAAPAQEEQGGGQQHHDRYGVGDVGDREDRHRGHHRGDAEQCAHHHVRASAGFFPLVGDPAAEQLADESGEEDDEARAAHLLQVEAAGLAQVGGHPGQQAVEHGVEAHPADGHAPDRAVLEEVQRAAAQVGRLLAVLQGKRVLDMTGFLFIYAEVFAWRVADVPPCHEAGQNRANAGHHERQAPRAQFADQPGNDERAERRAQRRAAVEQRGATAAFVLRHPDGIEFAAGRVDRGFRSAEPQPRQQQRGGIGADRCQRLERAPEHGSRSDHDARLVLVGQHAARHLHDGIGPEERTQDQPLHGGTQVEFLRDQRHGHRQRCAVDVVDRHEQQHHQEDLPSHAAAGNRERGCGGACGLHDGCLLVLDAFDEAFGLVCRATGRSIGYVICNYNSCKSLIYIDDECTD